MQTKVSLTVAPRSGPRAHIQVYDAEEHVLVLGSPRYTSSAAVLNQVTVAQQHSEAPPATQCSTARATLIVSFGIVSRVLTLAEEAAHRVVQVQ